MDKPSIAEGPRTQDPAPAAVETNHWNRRSPAGTRGDQESHDAGDPVCWLTKVCPECGLFAEDGPPTTCARCGAEFGT
jgi:hypothetical protein